jgi:hypothetical protein
VVIPASSTEYVHVPVTGPEGVEIDGSPPQLAFLPVSNRDSPGEDDWHTGDWDDSDARLLVGPDGGTVTLAKGDYRVYVSVDPPGPENIVRLSGYLSIT